MKRAAAAFAVIATASLFVGCHRADVLYDYEGNVIGPATHKEHRFHGVQGRHAQPRPAPVPAETGEGAAAPATGPAVQLP